MKLTLENGVTTSAELNTLTAKQLGSIAKEIGVTGWHEMRKEDLVRSLMNKSRTKSGGEFIQSFFQQLAGQETKQPEKAKKADSPAKKRKESAPKESVKSKADAVQSGKNSSTDTFVAFQGGGNLRRDISRADANGKQDRLILLVRDPYWIQAFWDISRRTTERAKVALGHYWYTSVPVLRLYRLESDGSGAPRKHHVRDITIHGGVNNWYIDVKDPPSRFIVELGYLTREKKFHVTLSSNEVITPQQQLVDNLERLDGNWKGIADDLDRVYKLSIGDGGNQELKSVFEEQLGRPITAQLLARQRVSKQSGTQDQTRRNFKFSIDTDVIIKGKTDPNVQVSIRNEPVEIKSDGTFSVRYAFPDKRHMFPIEAEGSDGVEKQTVILTIERNTRIMETVIQEPSDDD